MPLFGKDAKAYYSTVAFNGSNVPDDLTWVAMDRISEEADNFSPVEDDTTTRESASGGVATSAIVLSELEITFTYLMDLSDTVFSALWTAFQTRANFTALFLSGSKTSTTSLGVAANFSVALNWEKNVKGVQKASFTLKPVQYVHWVTGAASL